VERLGIVRIVVDGHVEVFVGRRMSPSLKAFTPFDMYLGDLVRSAEPLLMPTLSAESCCFAARDSSTRHRLGERLDSVQLPLYPLLDAIG